LVNCAGANFVAPLADHPPKLFKEVMDVNCTAVFALCQALMPLMKRSGQQGAPSNIINISSIKAVKV